MRARQSLSGRGYSVNEEVQFLEGLLGDWTLTGVMNLHQPDGSVKVVPINQKVEAFQSLRSKFVEVRCFGDDYEALYLLGYDDLTGKFVFHLFDSFGVSSDAKFGTGILRDDSIRFTFPYVTGPFYNELIREEDGWTWLLTFERDGEEKVFAEKRMTRVE